MEKPALPYSISLGPGHRKYLERVQKKIYAAVQEFPGRSQAIQVALLGFQYTPEQEIKKLVELNRRKNDGRRH